jgi:hypothetical protein
MFFLTAIKVAHILDSALPQTTKQKEDNFEKTKAEYKKRDEYEVLCRGHLGYTLRSVV